MACAKQGSVKLHTWMDIYGHTCSSFIDVGAEFILCFLDARRPLPSHRRTSLGFHSIWCLAKDSSVTDRVLKTPSWLKPLQGRGIFELLCGKKRMKCTLHVCLCECSCRLCSDRGLHRVQTSTGGEHTLAQYDGVKQGLGGGPQTVWMMCSCVFFSASEPHLTFWLSLPPREPLELGLNTQNADRSEMFPVTLRARLHLFRLVLTSRLDAGLPRGAGLWTAWSGCCDRQSKPSLWRCFVSPILVVEDQVPHSSHCLDLWETTEGHRQY